RARRRDGRGRRCGGGTESGGSRRVADGAQGARVRGASRGRRGVDEAAHAQLLEAAAHLDAQAGGRAHVRRDGTAARRGGERDRAGARGVTRVRRATQGDVAAMVDAMAYAFYDDPVFEWLFPDDEK